MLKALSYTHARNIKDVLTNIQKGARARYLMNKDETYQKYSGIAICQEDLYAASVLAVN